MILNVGSDDKNVGARETGPVRVGRYGLLLLFLVCGLSLPSLSGLLVPPFSFIPSSLDWPYRVALSTLFLIMSLVSSRREKYRKYWKVFFSFFVASLALSLQALSGFLSFQSSPVENVALAMISSTLLVTAPILALTVISGGRLHDVFLARGNVKRGLLIGFIGFGVFVLVSIPAATYLFQGHNLTAARALSWTAPLLVTVFANGVREELLYRGLFLKRYESLLGSKPSNVLQAVIFSLSHTVAGLGPTSYTPFVPVLVVFTLALGLVWGNLMQRTNSILGSVLFHAGSDIPVFLGIFSNLP